MAIRCESLIPPCVVSGLLAPPEADAAGAASIASLASSTHARKSALLSAMCRWRAARAASSPSTLR